MSVLFKDKTFLLATFSLILVSLIQTFRVEILDALFFFAVIFELLVGILLFVSLGVSTIYIYKHKRRLNTYTFIPLMFNLLTILIVLFTPFSDIMLKINFSVNKSAREEVIQLIKSEVLKSNVAHNKTLIHLPENYHHLSKGGGDVKVSDTEDGTAVFFYVFRGVLDNYSGFAYCPSENVDCTNSFVYENDIIQVGKLDDNWYWIASH